ncbi:MAG: Gfo/Idh/MocA family oxidoreductase [Sphingobacteriales bacterium]|nr:MAG: Gfo/Idh/MocA family oxidoreductase [Sphingobacteriales bacterium]
MKKLKVAIIGIGNLGMQYIIRLQYNKLFELVGVNDKHPEHYEDLKEESGINFYENADELTDACDALIICTPTHAINKYLFDVIKSGKHILLGKPILNDLPDILYINDIARESGIKMQISMVDSFNPVFSTLKTMVEEPMFVEIRRNTSFESSKNNPNIIKESLLKDICLLLELCKASNIQKIRYNNLYEKLDFVQVRIEFDNGTSAHISINKLSNQKSFTVQVYQANKNIIANFLNRRINTFTKSDNQQHVLENNIELSETEAIEEELNAFASSILNDTDCKNSIADFYRATAITYDLLKKIDILEISI